ncbi:NAD(P)H-binding protein [Stomatohabitans albus]|uniref:NAD(P)H-binding protein n=1 Tax=Stomatohabitans albus TaxID=3110766 RepID=UPI00300C54B6
MTATTLVAGATGYLGRFIVAELHRRGHNVRAIVRSRERALAPGPWESPSLEGLVDDWAVGAVSNPDFVADIAEGVDNVVSALGVTKQAADPWDIDHKANLAILRSAERHGVGQFCYINVIGGDQCPAQLTQAKTAFVNDLRSSSISSQIINPPGYFSDMTEILKMAQKGRVYVVRPDVRINPIHGADLAAYCIDRLTAGEPGMWDVGGPEAFTWQGLAECAFRALDRPVKISKLPPWLLSAAISVLNVFSPKKADTVRFVSWSMLHDCVGEPTGNHTLLDFFKRHAEDNI